MKILITLLLALFISGQAYALDSIEIIEKGKIISSEKYIGENVYQVFHVIYKKKLWVCQTEYRRGFEFNCLEFRSVDAEISVYD
tara:strand:- start:109 stop:360 length:252 start_codon:yes stop_codon:yes gene_type:complete